MNADVRLTPRTTAADAGKAPNLLTRFFAFLVDAAVVALLGVTATTIGSSPNLSLLGGLMGFAYLLFRDGLAFGCSHRRSLGKRLMRLSVARDNGLSMDMQTSARRNWPIALGSVSQLLLAFPLGWSFISLLLIAGATAAILESVTVLVATDGRRNGDHLAGTQVVVTVN
jgi:uncharacterized RDD family membrane protein YckC